MRDTELLSQIWLDLENPDKFISKYDYSYKHHIDLMKELVIQLDLRGKQLILVKIGEG